MGTFRKRSNSWRAEIKRNGVRESETFATKREAQDWAAQREAELSKSGSIIKKPLKDVAMRYHDEVTLNNPLHHRAEKNRITRFIRDYPSLVNKDIHTITTEDLNRFRDDRLKTVQPSSFLRELTILRSIWKAARKWKNTNSSPFTDFEPPADNPPRKRIYTDAEIDRILDALGYTGVVDNGRQETAVAMLLSLETALRSSELLSLRWEHVHLDERYVHLPRTKNGDARDVPLSTRAVELIRQMEGRDVDKVFRLSESKRDQYFRQARNLAEVKGATFHDIRATAITRLSKKLQVLELARMVGHRDIRSLQIYYRETATQIAAKLD